MVVSRSPLLEGLVVPCDFAFENITRRHSKDLQKELARSEHLRLQAVLKTGSVEEKSEAKWLFTTLQNKDKLKKRKTSEDDRNERRKRVWVDVVWYGVSGHWPMDGLGPCRLPALCDCKTSECNHRVRSEPRHERTTQFNASLLQAQRLLQLRPLRLSKRKYLTLIAKLFPLGIGDATFTRSTRTPETRVSPSRHNYHPTWFLQESLSSFAFHVFRRIRGRYWRRP